MTFRAKGQLLTSTLMLGHRFYLKCLMRFIPFPFQRLSSVSLRVELDNESDLAYMAFNEFWQCGTQNDTSRFRNKKLANWIQFPSSM